MKILIAGATGFVGTYLIDYLLEKGYSINALSRSKQVSHHKNLVYFRWDIHQQYIETNAFENVDTIINLTGANIGEKRWTKERKSEIIIILYYLLCLLCVLHLKARTNYHCLKRFCNSIVPFCQYP